MKLYIKEKVFSWGDKFTVKDELGNDKYTVAGEVFSLGKKLHIYNTAGTEVALIKQELWSWMPKFSLFCGGRQVAQIKKAFTFFLPKYTVEELGWEISGSFLEHAYQITKAERQIAAISKAWMSWGDSYELDIANPADELTALAAVLTIDCVTESDSGAGVSISSD
ncbi:MAG: LURP-one-related family protein [Oscillospiraceae bacterium]|nr:LURP-one-related family protein [Oscillospiraceae bacterium]